MESDKALYKEKVREHLGADIASALKKSHKVVDAESLFKKNGTWLEHMLDLPFITTVLSAAQIKRIQANPRRHYSSLLKVLYLFLFEQLFLSGRYEDEFGQSRIEYPLHTFVGK